MEGGIRLRNYKESKDKMLLTIFLIGLAVVALILGALMFFDKKSYKHEAIILKPTTEGSFILDRDKFKLRKKKTGLYEVWFSKSKGKAYNPPVSMWVQIWNSKRAVPDEDGILQADGDEIRKSILQGAIFVQVSPREYKLGRITNMGDIQVIDQDTIELVLDDIERTKELTTSFRDKLLQAGVWVFTIIAMIILFIVIFTLATQFAGEQAASILAQASNAAAQGSVGA